MRDASVAQTTRAQELLVDSGERRSLRVEETLT